MGRAVTNAAAGGLLWGLLAWGCAGPNAPMELTTRDPSQDHELIAKYYAREAQALRQTAADLRERASLYEKLFGLDSEWARSARLLAQFYEDSAADRGRDAEVHLGLAAGVH